jgi:hypothetical protein
LLVGDHRVREVLACADDRYGDAHSSTTFFCTG